MINNLYALKKDLSQAGVLYCYCGPITQEFTEATGRTLRAGSALGDTSPGMTMRIFAVFVEMVQNINLYSVPEGPPDSQDPGKTGIIVVGQENGSFFLHCGNQILRSSSARIEGRLQELQKMDKNALKEFYKEKRREGPDSESRGAGLGFIEIARKASAFSYQIEPINEMHAFFSLTVLL